MRSSGNAALQLRILFSMERGRIQPCRMTMASVFFLNYYKFGIVVDFFCFLLYLYIVFCFHELEIILFDGEIFKNTPLMR